MKCSTVTAITARLFHVALASFVVQGQRQSVAATKCDKTKANGEIWPSAVMPFRRP